MARQVVIDILGDAKNFTRATQEATAVSGNMTAGLGKASGAAKTLEKDLVGMGKGMAANIPVAGGFGGALGGLPLPALAAAAAIGGLVIAGKSIIEISDKWEAAQKGLEQATDSISGSYEGAQREVQDFISTNKRFISSQAEVVDSYAALLRQGLGTKKAQEDLNLALNLSKIKHIDLTSATTLLQQAEMGRGRALLPLGIQMKEYPILMETAAQAAKKVEQANKAVEVAQKAYTKAVHDHGAKSQQAKDAAVKLHDATQALAVAHNYATDRAKASAEVHELLHQKLDRGRESTSKLEQSQNRLGNAWQDLSQKVGPPLLEFLGNVVGQFADMVGFIEDVIGKIGELIGWISRIDVSKIPLIGGAFAAGSAGTPAGAHVAPRGRASGGSVLPYTDYTVGERGPETLRMGSQGGTIIPHGGGVGGGVTVHVHGFVGNPQELFKVFREGIRRLERAQS